jgi:DNA-binding CsgD family transcriptional regulator/pimeloyl-ACP methyl ester carboxylesterase
VDIDIQYATTADGVRVAYAVSGAGPVLVHMPNLGVGMLQAERAIVERGRWSDLLARRFTLVRYDARGTGYSQREVDDVSLEGHLLDLEAVVSALDLPQFVLFGFLGTTYIAPFYVARRPEMVLRLVLWPPDTRSLSSQEYRALGAMAVSDWETFTETYAHLAMGWAQGNVAHLYAKVMQESVSPQMFRRQIVEGYVPMDKVLQRVKDVQTPTLMLQRRMKFEFAAERVAQLVSALSDARLQILDGDSTVPYLGNTRAVVDVIARFVAARNDGEAAAGNVAIAWAGSRPSEVRPPLTEREREVLRLLAEGRGNEEIAGELVVSVRTVERHLSNIYDKMGVSGKSARAFAAAYAMGGQLG